MARPQYTLKTIDVQKSDIDNGLGFSVSTREKLDVYLEIPAQYIYRGLQVINKLQCLNVVIKYLMKWVNLV